MPSSISRGSDRPRISIVTPSLNQGAYIEETIRSVLEQGYPNLEYIVMDGGSTDQTVGILEAYDDRITSWVSEADGGQAEALNRGFARATGTILGYLNSDDKLRPDTLHRVADAFEEAGRRDALVYFAGCDFGENSEGRTYLPGLGPDLALWLSSEASLFQPSTFWTRWLWDRVGGFDTSYDFCFDKDFFIRAVFRYGTYIPRPEWVAAEFRVHPHSKTGRIADVRLAENQRLWRRYMVDPFYQRVLRRQFAERRADALLRAALDDSSTGGAVTGLLHAVRARPGLVADRMYLGAWKVLLSRLAGRGR